MKIQSDATRQDLYKRLRRVEGQMRGIQKMLEEDRDCAEIVQQLNASQAALRNATTTFMNAHARECLLDSRRLPAAEQAALVDELFGLMSAMR